jgi:hypothetical protein
MPFNDSKQQYPYRVYTLAPSFRVHSGLVQLPVAGPPGTAAVFVRLCAPSGEKVVHYEAVRDGAWPEVPMPEMSQSGNEVFLHADITPQTPIPIDGERFRYSLSGDYIYGLKVPNTPQDGFPTGMGPMMTDGAPGAFCGPENFSATILEPSRVVPPEGIGIQG